MTKKEIKAIFKEQKVQLGPEALDMILEDQKRTVRCKKKT